jgi:hypothetical protein
MFLTTSSLLYWTGRHCKNCGDWASVQSCTVLLSHVGRLGPDRCCEILSDESRQSIRVSVCGKGRGMGNPIKLDTGLRPEETFRIRVEHLDFTARTIFNPFGKTKAARRKVTMTADVHAILKGRAKVAKGPFVFPSKSSTDKPIGSVRKAHDKAVEDAGIGDHFRLYDLRHTFATRAVAGGVDLPTLSAMLGHTSIQMTMRYVHPAEEQKKIATGKLEAFRIAGIVQAIEKTRSLTTNPTTVN